MVAPALVVVAGGALVVAHVPPAGDGLAASRTGAPAVGGPDVEPAWRWPVGPLAGDGREPVISDGWGSPRDGGARLHRGADVGYQRTRGELPQYRPGTRQASKGGLFVMPDGTPILAMADGHVWSVSTSARGIQVVIDHGPFRWATYYQHLKTCRWGSIARGAGKVAVRAGQPIGTVGNGYQPGTQAPDGYNHPHVEFWRGGGAESAVDPKPHLARARHGAPVPW